MIRVQPRDDGCNHIGAASSIVAGLAAAEFHGSWAMLASEHAPGRHVFEGLRWASAINAPRLCGYDLRPFPISLAGFAHADASPFSLLDKWRPIISGAVPTIDLPADELRRGDSGRPWPHRRRPISLRPAPGSVARGAGEARRG